MKIDEIMFSDRELALMAKGKGKEMLKPSDKDVGPYAGLPLDARADLKAQSKERAKEQTKLNAQLAKIGKVPYYIRKHKERDKWIEDQLAALEKSEAEQREIEKHAAADNKVNKVQAKIDADIKNLNKPKKSQPLPKEPEDVKRRVPSTAERHYMDRYWDRHRD